MSSSDAEVTSPDGGMSSESDLNPPNNFDAQMEMDAQVEGDMGVAVEVCNDDEGMDEDGDDFVNCADSDCAEDAECIASACGAACEVIVACPEFSRACSEAVFNELGEVCRQVCTTDAGARSEIVAGSQLECSEIFSASVQGFDIEDDCPVEPEVCSNGRDDDADGLIDCVDSDCGEHPECVGAIPIADRGDSLEFTGSLDTEGNDEDDQEDDCCYGGINPDCSLSSSVSLQDTYRVLNTTEEQLTLQISVTWAAPENHGIVSVHDADFDAFDADRSCISASDRLPDGDTSSARIHTVLINPGEVLNIMVATFEMTEDQDPIPAGEFTLNILTIDEMETNCTNGVDDDENGLSDCLDPMCEGIPACANESVVLPTQGMSLTVTGELTLDDPQWARPDDNCSRQFSHTTNYYYDTIAIRNDSGQDQRVTFTLEDRNDAYVHIYEEPFDLTNRRGCIRGEDFRYFPDIAVGADQTIVAVVSTYQPAELEERYELTLSTHLSAEAVCAGDLELIHSEGVYQGVTEGPGAFEGSCGGGSSPEALYRLQTAEDTAVCITTDGDLLDPLVYVRTDCAAPESELVCNDDADGLMVLASQVEISAMADMTYTIIVDGSRSLGAFNMDVAFAPCSVQD